MSERKPSDPPALKALKAAVALFDNNQSAFARAVGAKQGSVWNWLNKTYQVPAEKVIAVEKATGGQITRHQLRPDLYPTDVALSLPKPEAENGDHKPTLEEVIEGAKRLKMQKPKARP